jgi:hypothetical protein
MYVNIANTSNLIIFIIKMHNTNLCMLNQKKLIDKILLYVYKYC